jgi:rhodanese-related sulfurtransferase
MPVANASHHLQVLREGGLVRSRKEGVQVIYRVSDDEIPTMLGCLRRVGERHIAEVALIVREHFSVDDGLRPVNHRELETMVKSGDALVIDVRPPEEYEAGHIRGAVNIPLNALPRQLAKLPRGKEIIAYCRGPYCMLAFKAVRHLQKLGYRARRFEEGFPEWKAEGLPVTVGS